MTYHAVTISVHKEASDVRQCLLRKLYNFTPNHLSIMQPKVIPRPQSKKLRWCLGGCFSKIASEFNKSYSPQFHRLLDGLSLPRWRLPRLLVLSHTRSSSSFCWDFPGPIHCPISWSSLLCHHLRLGNNDWVQQAYTFPVTPILGPSRLETDRLGRPFPESYSDMNPRRKNKNRKTPSWTQYLLFQTNVPCLIWRLWNK